jgi:hypothetical protein
LSAFKLALPPSANDLVRPTVMYLGNDRRISALVQRLLKTGELTARLVSTREAKEFRQSAHARLPVAPIPGPVEIYATFTVPTISSDCSNRMKALEDALNGKLFYDDKQIGEGHTAKVIGEVPGCVVEVVPGSPVEHAELARRLAKSSIQERANQRAQPSLFTPTPNFKANR